MTPYRTIVRYAPPTPLGLIGGSWIVTHWCRTCRQRVDTKDLIPHAMDHDRVLPSDAGDEHNGIVDGRHERDGGGVNRG